MTKLEWCRANAPDSFNGLSDDELLQAMEPMIHSGFVDVPDFDTEEADVSDAYSVLMSKMDKIVLMLVREYGNKLAFKGGYMLSKLLGGTARQTTDIDFSISDSELYKSLIQSFTSVGDLLVAEGYIDRYVVKDVIERFRSGGMDMYSANGDKILGIDVGWHDIYFGTTSTDIKITSVNAFTVERMLSDKVTAILSRKRFRRPKDIYDVYCLTNVFDYDSTLVADFILKRTEGAGAEWGNYPFTEVVLREYEKAYNSLNVRAVTKTYFDKPEFDKVMQRFDLICSKLLYPDLRPIWDHTKEVFVECRQ